MTTKKRHKRILLAEDNPSNQFLGLLILREMRHQTDVVSDGVAAVAALKNVPYDLVIMDRKMPEMDGCEAAMRIRMSESGVLNPDVPIIAYTAAATDDEIRQCFAAGMNDYIAKPMCLEEFKKSIQVAGKIRWTGIWIALFLENKIKGNGIRLCGECITKKFFIKMSR